MNSSDLLVIVSLIITLVIIGGLIALAVYLVRKSNAEARQAELAYNLTLQKLPSDKQMLFVMQYNAAKKSPTTAVLLALFLGGLGAHKFYLGQTGLGVLYLVFCWTYIPAILGLVEAFVIAGQVGKYNQRKIMETSALLGGTYPVQMLPSS